MAHIREAVDKLPPRRPPAIEVRTRLAGLEPLNIGPDSLFVNVGERTNVTGPLFRRLIEADDYTGALEVARQQVASGATSDRRQHGRGDARFRGRDGPLPQPARGRTRRCARAGDDRFLEVVGDRSGLKCLQGKGVVNSISLKEGETPFLAQARRVRAYGAAVVVMAFDESGRRTR